MNDKKLLEYYMQGFRDELDGIFREVPEKAARAYNLGRDHAIIGDDNPLIDHKSSRKILKEIKR